MLGMASTTEEQWTNSFMEFCGEYGVSPEVGVNISWFKAWINDAKGEGYLSGSVLHNYLFGVRPKPSRRDRVPPTVSEHPADFMVKPITTTPSASSSSTLPMVFPPVPPGLIQPSTSSSSSSKAPMPKPSSMAPFPLPPVSLRSIDTYPMVGNADNNQAGDSIDEENEP